MDELEQLVLSAPERVDAAGDLDALKDLEGHLVGRTSKLAELRRFGDPPTDLFEPALPMPGSLHVRHGVNLVLVPARVFRSDDLDPPITLSSSMSLAVDSTSVSSTSKGASNTRDSSGSGRRSN